jgi:4-amino-4-deoxy-L-arabinose transferase-like glycosyltransferase
MVRRKWQVHHTLMLSVILIALFIRFHGLVWTLPYHFNGDETRIISNGITVYQEGVQSYSADVASMTNYPPLRGWEIAGTRAILMTVFGGVSNGEQVLWGRMFSLFYALMTLALLYQLGKTVSRNPYVGIVAALLLAVWAQTIDIGQRTLSDGAGMMFFTVCAWLSVLAYRRLSYRLLVLAIVAGITFSLSWRCLHL